MYNDSKNSILKHADFMFLDAICLLISYIIAYVIRHWHWYIYGTSVSEYFDTGIALLIMHFVTVLFDKPYKSILRREVHEEIQSVVRHNLIIYILLVLYLFLVKHTSFFARLVFIYSAVISTMLMTICHLFWKKVLHLKYRLTDNVPFLCVVASNEKMASEFIKDFNARGFQNFRLKNLLLLDGCGKKELLHIPVSGSMEEFLEYARINIIDEVLFYTKNMDETAINFFYQLMAMGITVHFSLDGVIEELPEGRIGRVGGFTVMTASLKFATDGELAIKRLMDIAGSLVGLLITGIAFIFVAPIIYIQSPGPIFFSQERVGKNGRKFRIYKFRSMYMDAEERKKELMAQNKMQGLMFKMDNDPRIFPFGHFIRRTSIDELPQFWNILKGDMSLVGTRPPTVDEYEQYELRHKVRLSVKPGLTGMWQVSGRSDITDFDEVVALDEKYVSEWSVWLDIKILFKTIKVVLLSKGAE